MVVVFMGSRRSRAGVLLNPPLAWTMKAEARFWPPPLAVAGPKEPLMYLAPWLQRLLPSFPSPCSGQAKSS